MCEYIKVSNEKYLVTNLSDIDIVDMIEKYNENKSVLIIDVNNKINYSGIKNFNNLIFNISIDNSCSVKYSINIIKKLKKLFKVCDKHNVIVGIKNSDKTIIGNICFTEDIKDTNIVKNNIVNSIKALFLKNTRQRYEYIYDEVCDYLDNKFIEQGQCEFKNDICIEKRKCKKVTSSTTMGCCHHCKNQYLGIILLQKFELCKYLKDKRCLIRSISCKLYTCDTLKSKGLEYRINDIAMLNVFFNNFQKFILKVSVFKTKDETIDRLMALRFLI